MPANVYGIFHLLCTLLTLPLLVIPSFVGFEMIGLSLLLMIVSVILADCKLLPAYCSNVTYHGGELCCCYHGNLRRYGVDCEPVFNKQDLCYNDPDEESCVCKLVVP